MDRHEILGYGLIQPQAFLGPLFSPDSFAALPSGAGGTPYRDQYARGGGVIDPSPCVLKPLVKIERPVDIGKLKGPDGAHLRAIVLEHEKDNFQYYAAQREENYHDRKYGEDGIDPDDFRLARIAQEVGKIHVCGEYYHQMRGKLSGDSYYHRLDCRKWWCPSCGDVDGNEGIWHREKKMAVYAKMAGGVYQFTPRDMKKLAGCYIVEQGIFEIPTAFREIFMDRKKLNEAIGCLRRLVADEFPGYGVIEYTHLMGDLQKWWPEDLLLPTDTIIRYGKKGRDGKRYVLREAREDEVFSYHPHFNIHVFIPKKDWPHDPVSGRPIAFKDFVSEDQLKRIKKRWKHALAHIGCAGIKGVDVQFSYRAKPKHIMHAIKYMTHPPDQRYMALWNEEDVSEENRRKGIALREFFTIGLKRFLWVRAWQAFSNSEYKDPEKAQELDLDGIEKVLAKEALESVGRVPRHVFEALRDNAEKYETTTLADGFFRIHDKSPAPSSLPEGVVKKVYVLRK